MERTVLRDVKISRILIIFICFTRIILKIQLLIFLPNHGKAELDIKKVPVGDQSLDKHLIAYLGFLVGKNVNKKTEYVIISSDKGYDKVGEFLREEGGKSISVSRRCTIAAPKDAQKKEEKQNVEKKVSVSKVDSVNKSKLNQQVQQALSASEIQYRPCVMNDVAKVVTSLYGNEKFNE